MRGAHPSRGRPSTSSSAGNATTSIGSCTFPTVCSWPIRCGRCSYGWRRCVDSGVTSSRYCLPCPRPWSSSCSSGGQQSYSGVTSGWPTWARKATSGTVIKTWRSQALGRWSQWCSPHCSTGTSSVISRRSGSKACASKARSHWARMRLHVCGAKDDDQRKRQGGHLGRALARDRPDLRPCGRR